VGALRCLAEQGITPDAIVGSSIGVINACIYASGGIEALEKVWSRFRAIGRLRPSFRHNPVTGLSLFDPEPFARAVEQHIDFEAVCKSPLDLSFILLNISRGRGEFVSNRHVESAAEMRRLVRAGYALPGFFPPVRVGGDWYVDGGLAWNVPLLQAVEMGATEIHALTLASTALAYRRSFRTFPDFLGRLMDVLWVVIGNAGYSTTRIEPDGTYRGVPVTVIQPGERYAGLDLFKLFAATPSRSRALMVAGYADAKRELARRSRARTARARRREAPEAPLAAFRNEVA
jgi:predicted acylesterase/phospholipase RssA